MSSAVGPTNLVPGRDEFENHAMSLVWVIGRKIPHMELTFAARLVWIRGLA